MRIADQALKLQQNLDQWIQQEGGKCIVAFDAVHMWSLLLSRPGTIRIVVAYDGESPRETFPGGSITGRVDRRFLIGVSRGRGLNPNRGDNLIGLSGGGRPLFEFTEEVAALCRGIIMDPMTTERPVEYKGITRLDIPGMIVDAFQIEISIGTQLPIVTDQPQTLGGLPP